MLLHKFDLTVRTKIPIESDELRFLTQSFLFIYWIKNWYSCSTATSSKTYGSVQITHRQVLGDLTALILSRNNLNESNSRWRTPWRMLGDGLTLMPTCLIYTRFAVSVQCKSHTCRTHLHPQWINNTRAACVCVFVNCTYAERRWVVPSAYSPRHAGDVRVALSDNTFDQVWGNTGQSKKRWHRNESANKGKL